MNPRPALASSRVARPTGEKQGGKRKEIKAIPDEDIDYSDIPELGRFFSAGRNLDAPGET